MSKYLVFGEGAVYENNTTRCILSIKYSFVFSLKSLNSLISIFLGTPVNLTLLDISALPGVVLSANMED
jgi:hypothetical protein